jgi:hypothetical protein
MQFTLGVNIYTVLDVWIFNYADPYTKTGSIQYVNSHFSGSNPEHSNTCSDRLVNMTVVVTVFMVKYYYYDHLTFTLSFGAYSSGS